MLNGLFRLFRSKGRVPRLRVTPNGFAVDYPGFPGLSLDVRWENVLEVRARRGASTAAPEVRLWYRFRPGKPLDATISETWPGFGAVRVAMEGALVLRPPDWWGRATALPPGGDVELYRRPSPEGAA
jgi:hypothetical protein